MMRLNVNRWIVRNGSIVEVSWDATGMSFPQLVMKVSGKETVIDIEHIGSKKFRLNGVAFKRKITLVASDEKGVRRHIERDIYTWGKCKENIQYDSYVRISPFRQRLTAYRQIVKRYWNCFPREKRRLYLILVFLMTSLTFVSSRPELAKTFTIMAMGYILYIIIKR